MELLLQLMPDGLSLTLPQTRRAIGVIVGNPTSWPLALAQREATSVFLRCGSKTKNKIFWHGTISDVQALLVKKRYKILHFIVHGDAIWAQNPTVHTPGLCDQNGRPSLCSPDDFANTLVPYARFIELVFLNGCLSSQYADKLVRGGIKYVVCWETIVLDEAATIFAEAFYGALGDGTASSYEEAFQHAHDALDRMPSHLFKGVPRLLKL